MQCGIELSNDLVIIILLYAHKVMKTYIEEELIDPTVFVQIIYVFPLYPFVIGKFSVPSIELLIDLFLKDSVESWIERVILQKILIYMPLDGIIIS